jgi:hypothetical protein
MTSKQIRLAMVMLSIGYKQLAKDTGMCRSTLSIMAETAGREPSREPPKLHEIRNQEALKRYFEEQGVIFFSAKHLWADGVARADTTRK